MNNTLTLCFSVSLFIGILLSVFYSLIPIENSLLSRPKANFQRILTEQSEYSQNERIFGGGSFAGLLNPALRWTPCRRNRCPESALLEIDDDADPFACRNTCFVGLSLKAIAADLAGNKPFLSVRLNYEIHTGRLPAVFVEQVNVDR